MLKELSLTNTWNNNVSNFIDICMRTLDEHAPLKKKYIRGNHLPFMNKELSKAIIKQRDYCVSLLRRIKKDYNSSLNENIITDNKKFWKSFTPFLSYKVLSNETITSIENDEIVNDDNETTNIINTFSLT